jgi:hypothetical protein
MMSKTETRHTENKINRKILRSENSLKRHRRYAQPLYFCTVLLKATLSALWMWFWYYLASDNVTTNTPMCKVISSPFVRIGISHTIQTVDGSTGHGWSTSEALSQFGEWWRWVREFYVWTPTHQANTLQQSYSFLSDLSCTSTV